MNTSVILYEVTIPVKLSYKPFIKLIEVNNYEILTSLLLLSVFDLLTVKLQRVFPSN